MTPLGGLLRRIRGTSSPVSPSAPPRAKTASPERPRGPSSNGATHTADGAPADDGTRRRRGRRGGRNRNKGERASTPEASTNGRTPSSEAPSSEASGTKPAARPKTERRASSNGAARGEGRTSDSYRWGRRAEAGEADERSRQSTRRRRDVRSRYLDAPLPEDVAFRPGDEGGDSTILPSRRRRPSGLHDTARILVGGARTLGGWVKRDGVEEQPRTAPRVLERAVPTAVEPDGDLPADTLAAEDVDAEGDGPEAPRKRRRGRRGGRGRRRPDAQESIEGDPSSGSEADDVDDIEDGEDEEPEAPPTRQVRAPRALVQIPDDQLPQAFASLGVSRTTLETIARFGFAEPTPIQCEAIPVLLAHHDVVGIAQTGSGKTIAFGAPMMECLDANLPEIQGLVLVPTRELAQQVLDVLQDLGEPWGLTAVGLLGGHSLRADFRALEGRPHIVVGTPGRILDHLRRQTLSLRSVRYAVLDEADQMLDIGFLPDIRRILSRTPQRRQTALFSATMPGSIKRLIWQFMTDPQTVRVDPESTTVDSVSQRYFEVAQRDKVRGLRELVERELKGRTLIFCNTKRGVDHVTRELERDGVRVGALHGDMDQKRRDRVVQDFRAGALDVLIATNVAARGLDIPEITHVVNYDVPQNVEEYVHRIGRTGRAGREGKAITFVSEWDMEAFDDIKRGVGVEIGREHLDLYGQAS